MNSRPLKIAQCLAGAERGGAEMFYARLVSALAENEHLQQRAFTRNYPQRIAALTAAGVPVSTFRFGSSLNVVNNWRYRRALRAYAPDIVLTYMNRASRLTPAGKYQLVCRLGHYYNLKHYRHANYWVGISQGICDHMVAGGMPADRVFLIQNFADETPVTPLPRNSFSTPVDQPLLVAAGRLHINKGFDILLRALSGIPNACLWLAGSGPEEQSLKALATELKLEDRIRFLGWRDDVTTLMATGDLFICPSRHEGLGSIVVESWAHNCPIVATNSQGPGELIEHGRTGLLSEVDDVEALRHNIVTAINDSSLRKSLIENARQHYDSHFSRRVISQQYCELFDLVMARCR